MAVAFAMGCVLLLATFVGVAFGGPEDSDQNEPAPLISPSVDSVQELNAITAGGEEESDAPEVDSAAAEALPHSALDRGEAEDLLVSVFPTATQDPGGIFSAVEMEAYRSDHVAVVPPEQEGAPAGLLTSLLPLRTEGDQGVKRPVDLALEAAAGSLVPANPIEDVRIPLAASGSIELPEAGVGVSVESQAAPSASTIEDGAAFYPNIAEDTDLLVVPAPTGVETFTHLRSPSAPTTQRLDLSIPQGAAVMPTDDGGAAVRRNGETLVSVHAPNAVDANGESVPVDLTVVDNSLRLTTSTDEDTAYPVLVDPLIEGYAWQFNGSPTGIYSDWRSYVSDPSHFEAFWAGIPEPSTGTIYSGLGLRTFAGPIAPASSANFNYYVPRYFSDYAATGKRPTSFIRNMYLGKVYYLVEENSSAPDPQMIAGIWDGELGTFHTSTVRLGTQGSANNFTITLPNTQENINVKNGGIALANFGSTNYKRHIFVGEASVEVSDKDNPTWGYLLPSGWTNNLSSNAPLDYAASDSGLGIYSFQLTRPSIQGGAGGVTIWNECVGNASNPCPATTEATKRAVPYDPANVAQGVSTMSVVAQDPVGNKSAPKLVQIKVDHDAPTLSLSGNATEQATVGTKLSQYTLNYTAKDGDDAAASAISPVGTVGTGTGQIERAFGVAADPEGNVWVADTTNNRLVKYDKNGTYIRQIASVEGGPFSGLRGITVTPDGSVWVAESTGHRLDQFNGFTGQILSMTAVPAYEPFDLAVAPDQSLWVTDPNNKKVYKYTPGGSLSQTISIPQPQTGVALPFGIDLDDYGNPWVALQGTNQIVELNPSNGKVGFTFGKEGSEAGQLKAPFDVSIASSGNIFVSDAQNNRIQEFKPDGTFLRQFGTLGAASNQLENPKNIDIASGNKLLVADYGNRRIARWEHADQDPQSGASKVEVKIDGKITQTNSPGCSSKNCVINGSWILKADEYTVGTHKIEVIATDGVNISSVPAIVNVQTHGDRTAPTVSLSGSLTEQATLGKTLPTYKLKVAATDPGPAEERQSGVAKIEIMLDGKVVDSVAPGCPAGGCALNREWTLKSSSYTAGWHWLEVITTDAAGKVRNSFREFEIKRDTTAPELALSGALAEAPDGWIQEGTRSLTTDATDVGGYGVKQTRFQIDGQLVGESPIQTCELGGCTKSKTYSIDMTAFGGGAHEGVAIAEDLAGNIRKRTWTINVDPLGKITISEVADTVAAVEETAPEVVELSPVPAITSAKAGEGGTDPQLTLAEGQIVGKDNSTPTSISLTPSNGFAVTTESTSAAGVSHAQTIGVSPVAVGTEAGTTEIVNGSAAVVANVTPHVDAIMRPIFNGLMTFQTIRDAAASETYSWQIKMGPEEELKQISPSYAGVFWKDGTEAMLIEAQAAHGADGQKVPTTLAVSEGNVLTLTVHHRNAGVVYPVTNGVGWQGGIITEEAIVTEPEFPYTYETETTIFEDPPPEVYPESASEPSSGASSSSVPAAEPVTKLLKKFGAHQCEKVPPLSPIKGCSIWEQNLKGFFWYNYDKAWATREPKCPNDGSIGVTVNNPSVCNWVGPKSQKYGHGYHITSQAIYDVTYAKISDTKEKHLSVYAYGSGYWNDHDTDCVCNPLPTG